MKSCEYCGGSVDSMITGGGLHYCSLECENKALRRKAKSVAG